MCWPSGSICFFNCVKRITVIDQLVWGYGRKIKVLIALLSADSGIRWRALGYNITLMIITLEYNELEHILHF